jgi:hypothetical protein
MDEILKELEEDFSFRLVVDFRELNKRVVPDPCPLPRPKEMAVRIGMENKPFKTVLDFEYGSGAMGYYKDHRKLMAVITPFGVFVPTRLGFGGKWAFKDSEDI